MDDILKDIFEFKKKKRYRQKLTLREFSRFLGINIATLSRVFAGKETLSVKQAEKIIANKNIDDQFKSRLVSKYFPSLANDLAAFRKRAAGFVEKEIDFFDYNWLDIALLEFFNIKKTNQSRETLAHIFSVTLEQIDQSVEKLKKHGMIYLENGRYLKSNQNLFFRDNGEGSTGMLREYLRDLALRGTWELNKTSARDRQDHLIHSITFAVHSSKIPEAKRRIETFQDELSEFLTSGEQDANAIYAMNNQFFPLAKNFTE